MRSILVCYYIATSVLFMTNGVFSLVCIFHESNEQIKIPKNIRLFAKLILQNNENF